jgi:hypothetical protein
MVEADDTLLNRRAYNNDQAFNGDSGDEVDNPDSSSHLMTRTAGVVTPE